MMGNASILYKQFLQHFFYTSVGSCRMFAQLQWSVQSPSLVVDLHPASETHLGDSFTSITRSAQMIIHEDLLSFPSSRGHLGHPSRRFKRERLPTGGHQSAGLHGLSHLLGLADGRAIDQLVAQRKGRTPSNLRI